MELTKEDYIIICGDFGLCWAKDKTFEYHCKNFAEKPYTILWVQGNHENYDMIGEYPLEEWHGGKARHIIRDRVILLERGQVFEIDGKTFFTFGGASSHDIQGGIMDRQTVDFAEQKRRADRNYLPYRILQESWWPQELPTEGELQEGLRNLERYHYEVDYVITHTCPLNLIPSLGGYHSAMEERQLQNYLQYVNETVYDSLTRWYFGHWHRDQESVSYTHLTLPTILRV